MYRVRIIMGAVVAAFIAGAMLPSAALCIPRDVVIARGMTWVNYVRGVDPKTHKKVLGVPYSQARWALESGVPITAKKPAPSTIGYRTDCSGFASMCWNLRDSGGHPVSLSTLEFGAKGSKRFFPIAKAQLQPGDMVLASSVWKAPSPHAIIFAGWVDAKQTKYWALEETTNHAQGVTGSVLHQRDYGQAYFKPYRYSGLDDAYSDVEERIISMDPAGVAVAGSKASFPATSGIQALVIAGASQWGDQLTGAALAGAAGGPLLLGTAAGLPPVTVAEIRRLKPRKVLIVGSTGSVGAVAASQLASLTPYVVRIAGGNRFDVAANAASYVVDWDKARKRPIDRVYVAPGVGTAEALAISPVAARTGVPILFTNKTSMSKTALLSLKHLKIKHVVLVGGTTAVGPAVEKHLRALGYRVDRIGGADGYKTSVAVGSYALKLGVGFTLKRAGVVTPASCAEALASVSSFGATGGLLIESGVSAIDPSVRPLIAARRAEIGRLRVFGDALTYAARSSLASALRTGK